MPYAYHCCRDVQGLAGGPASYVHLSPECRCPPSHPVASSLTDCVQYAGSVVVNRGSVRRVNADAHPVGLINSGGFTSPWVSQLNRKDAEVVIDLGTLPYEVWREGIHHPLCSGHFVFRRKCVGRDRSSSAVPSHYVCVCVCVCVRVRVCVLPFTRILFISDYVMWFHMSDTFPLNVSDTLAHHFYLFGITVHLGSNHAQLTYTYTAQSQFGCLLSPDVLYLPETVGTRAQSFYH